MSVIDRIKDDLKKIFEPPTEDEQQMSVGLMFKTVAQRDFAARADQRITFLVEYYEAAEAWLDPIKGYSNYRDFHAKKYQYKKERLKQARAKLEKEE
mgnify:CR=1 FL=1